MIKQFLRRLFSKSKTVRNTSRPAVAPEVIPLGEHLLAKVNVEAWNPEEQRALHVAATEMTQIKRYAGHVQHGYALHAVATATHCPRCQSETHQYYANFIYATQTEPRVLFAPAGYFCPHCPTVIIDEEMLRSGVTGSYTFQGVLGIEEEAGQKPDFFLTWNGQKAVYVFDENQRPEGIVTMRDARRLSHRAPRAKRSGRQRLAKDSRRRNQRKK